MKNRIARMSLCATLIFASVAPGLFAGEPGKPAASAEFEKMKSLVGTWQGKTDMGQGPVDMTVQYRLIAAGSVLEERIFPNSPNEMVTMYYDKDGKLALTHYCMLGNRPALALKASESNKLTFDFDGSCCTINPAKESHMHAMTIRFDDADTVTTGCSAIIDGKEAPAHETTLKRVKTDTASN